MAKRIKNHSPREVANPSTKKQGPQASFTFWAGLIATVFAANGAIMVLEIIAGPLTARYLGSSLYTWTTIIGVVLGGMAMGNYLGGRLADRYRPAPLLGVLFLAAAAGCLLILGLNQWLGNLSLLRGWPWPARIFTHLTLTFLGPALLLGTVNPVATRLGLGRGKPDGRAVGTLYASTAAGSILGTFLAGYYLVMILGVSQIVLLMAAALALLGVIHLFVGRKNTATTRAAEDRREPLREGKLPWTTWLAPNATVFLSNAAFMTVELAASRMATRTLGHSLHTWTTLLGVVLAGVTVGNYVGGRLADRFTPRRLLAFLFPLSALVCLTIPAINEYLAFGGALTRLSWMGRTFWHIGLAFFLPCTLLGAISPAAAKLALRTRRAQGNALGNVYAWGALGSVAATFFTGYVLIDRLWPISTICTLAVLLALGGSLYSRRNYVNHLLVGLCALALLVSLAPSGPLNTLGRAFRLREAKLPGLIYEDHSQYAWVGITDDADYPGHRKMILDSLNHSEIVLSQPDRLMFYFWWVYDRVIDDHFPGRKPLKSLTIGGGGYVFPHYLERSRPGSEVQVAEIDPAVTKAARAAFGLPEDSTIQVFDMDGRNHVEDLIRQRERNPETPPFDVIIGDSINQYSVPFQLTTKEFNEDIYSLLGDTGLYLLNTTDRFDSGRFLGAVINTCRQVFPQVGVFSCRPRDAAQHDSFVVVCAKQPLDLAPLPGRIRSKYPFYTGDLLTTKELDELVDRAGHRVLTDNHAPVDNLVADIETSQRVSDFEARENYARVLLAKAEATSAAKKYAEALPQYQQLVKLFPKNPQLRTALGVNLTRMGRAEEGLAQFRAAIESAPGFAAAYNGMGAALVNLERPEEALRQFAEAIRCDPKYADALGNRARLLGGLGRFEESANAFAEAVAVTPKDPSLRYGHAQALRKAGQFAAAAKAAEAALAITPTFMQARLLLGQIFAQQGDFQKAVAPLEQVIQEQPKHALGHFLLGGVYYQLNRKKEAAAQYLEAYRLQPEHEDAGNNAGAILIELGRFDEAVKLLDDMVEKNPFNEKAARELEKARAAQQLNKQDAPD